jgi:hypothetical protein
MKKQRKSLFRNVAGGEFVEKTILIGLAIGAAVGIKALGDANVGKLQQQGSAVQQVDSTFNGNISGAGSGAGALPSVGF